MPESVVIPARFNGPLESGNGGYSCGVVAGLVDGPAEVNLRSPVPLDEALEVTVEEDGSVRVSRDGDLVADGHPAPELEVEVPGAITLEEARDAARRYRGLRESQFSRCFVCGLDREDSFGVYAGQVSGRELVASPWTPAAWTADGEGNVLAELIWAVLDCPTYFAAYMERDPLPTGFLVRQQARVLRPVPSGTEHVVASWLVAADGSKSLAGSAVLSAGGETLAVSHVLLVEPRPRD